MISRPTFALWSKQNDRLCAALALGEMGNCKKKACYDEHLWRVKKGNVAFYRINEMKKGKDRLPITGAIISKVTEEFRDNILGFARDGKIELDETEQRHLKKCQFLKKKSWS